MPRAIAAIVAILLLAAAPPQDDAKERAKKKEEAAKAALKAYRDERAKAKAEDDHVRAIEKLAEADPHALIRTELVAVLNSTAPDALRVAAAAGLKLYKKDAVGSDALIRNAKARQGAELRKQCLKTFGAIAPFGKSVELGPLFAESDTGLAREAIDAAATIRSVRMLRPLVDLYGELDRIRDDSHEVPGQAPSGGGQDVQRKKDLLDATKGAVNAIWSKHEAGKGFKTYTEAHTAVTAARAALRKLQDDEDRQDKEP